MLTACASDQRRIEIVYQDQTLVVLNKPGGLAVLRSAAMRELTLQDWVETNLGIKVANRAGIAHRLDKETWGLILVAKSQPAFNNLQHQFKKRRVEKTYWALVRGEPPVEGEVVAPIARARGKRPKFAVVPRGKPAQTSYRVIRKFVINAEKYSLLVIWPKTGRTHQIRVHLQYLGYPIFGDAVYGGKQERNKLMFLVAKKIGFWHPQRGVKMNFEIALPAELAGLLSDDERKS